MKFCPNCGTQLPDDAGFCTNCGNRFESQPQPQPQQQAPNNQYGYQAPNGQAPYGQVPNNQYGYQAPNNQAPYGQAPNNQYGYQAPNAQAPKKESIITKTIAKIKGMDKKKLLVFGGAILAGIIAIVVALSLLTGPKALARKYVNAYLKGNAKQYVNCMPSYMFEDKEDKKDKIEYYEDLFDERDSEYKNVKIEKIIVKKVPKDTKEDFKDSLKSLEYVYDNFDADKLNVNSLRYVSVFVSYKDEDGNPCSDVWEFAMAKYKGKWTILN